MAHLPTDAAALRSRFGPHLNSAPPGGWDADPVPERTVETHCCFCGQQCGIKLKVAGNQVVGFDPWEAFPFNKGKLCPKGVKRYLQGGHPDRLLHAMKRTASGFEPMGWEEAMERTVAEITRIQDRYGKDAFAMLSGVSLTNEKSYLAGKFARLALGTRNLDYNGRLCMVSAGAGNKKAFGVDRAANSWEDIPLADVIWVTGANVAECAPITTDYIWRARDRGAKLIVVDPRITPLARTADLALPLRPGTDSALTNGILHLLDQWNLVDRDFVRDHTNGFDEALEAARACTPQWTSAVTGLPVAAIEKAARMWGEASTSFLLHARGIEHQSKGVENVNSCINMVLATGRIGRPGCGYATITGQGNGQGGREHGHKCDQLPGNRDIENPEHRAHICGVWGCTDEELPGKGLSAQEIMNAIHEGDIKGLLCLCFNPLVSLPDSTFTREALEKLEFFVSLDFFLSETAQHADIIFPSALHEEDDGTSTSAEGRVIRIRKAVEPPGEARTDWEILVELARRLGRGRFFDHFTSPGAIFQELRRASSGGTADYGGITYEKIEKQMGVFWPCPTEDHPGTPRLFEGGKFFHPDGRARFIPTPWRPPMEEVDADYPVWLTSGRVVFHYLSGTQTRRIGFLVEQCPHPYVEIHPRLAANLGIREGDATAVATRRGELVLPAKLVTTIRPDTVFIPYHWPGNLGANRLTARHLDPVSRIPEFKVSACRVTRTTPDRFPPELLELMALGRGE
ncbi:molybdopterin oxidoreductase family protein [Mesoterricola silvestris]|uniref:Assimilatory nitrate reductase catalytic subunit n=1 Tax=Mesoterricola silvestris TaxID=2927979 RepID=A0AA48GP62_9BACT|nr:molybdopterin oxidoreductase family protein [Mesoterricola silvestris]BDU73120.1 assimilatory nitrate reductase catalytic subunit [Mesoterricola silvestris]